ncbi:hypothetical protein B1R32_1038 [Abditibacterium utsteinense]|uniref:Uncharacterized protein n=1 Tax=Abditibacterium utsteinense TaxID=1960156 RepID=A0A2S8SVD2_9BACT|nr:hypothetical protein B1R32_1038 [Abditibacterium utsteinense]
MGHRVDFDGEQLDSFHKISRLKLVAWHFQLRTSYFGWKPKLTVSRNAKIGSMRFDLRLYPH